MGSLESVGRVLLSLGFVLGVMWLVGRWVRGRNSGRSKSRQALTVLARQQLTRNASIAVVKVADRAMVLGITDSRVALIGETDLATMEAQVIEPSRKPSVRPRAVPGPATGRPAANYPVVPPPSAAAGSRRHRAPGVRGGLEGSALSPATWSQALDALRERTVRR